MKVYVVQKGEYSDRRIVAVTLDSEKANSLADLHRGNNHWTDYVEVEVYDTDNYDAQLCLKAQNLKPYMIFYYKDLSTKMVETDWEMFDTDNLPSIEKWLDCYVVKMFARDEEHAKKIANDVVAEYKYRVEVEGIPEDAIINVGN